MIVPFITLVVGGAIGFVGGRAVGSAERENVKSELAELRRRLELAQGRGTPIPALLPADEYREPDTAAVINIPVEFDELGQYRGTYFSLRSSGDELEPGENTTLTGALFGTQVEVDEDSTIIGMPSVEAYLAFFGL